MEKLVKLSLKSENDCLLIREVNSLVAKAKNCVIITGTGILYSDFRSSYGLYNMIKRQYLNAFRLGKDLFDTQLLRTHDSIKAFNFFIDMKKLKRVNIQIINNLEEIIGLELWNFERVKNCQAQVVQLHETLANLQSILYGDNHPKELEIGQIATYDQNKANSVHERKGYMIMINDMNIVTKE
ncbi:558_t:CDS:2 [Gigaspora margarita]|uniref:558_t:CDS:1 n=1 Tax=Gigaspora margarita TaxID=4874 RepID=A0ABM8W5X2_GIGMA|nr:558_t:CDS:2 [Gigaspora margarita]